MRARFFLLLPFTLAACVDPVVHDDNTAMTLPPIGLAATAVWLDAREAQRTTRRPASSIPTEDLCDIVDDCLSPVHRVAQ